MRFTLRRLAYFVAVAEAGSITEASRRLAISQPSLSEAIATLERSLDVQLFVRQFKGLRLTNAGSEFLGQARTLLALARELEATAGSLGQGLKGEISVGCLATLAPFILPALLKDFALEYPEIAVATQETGHEQLLANLRDGSIEMAFTYLFRIPEAFEYEVFAVLPPRILLAEDHPLATREALSLAEIADEPLILLDIPYSREYFLGLFQAAGVEPRIGHRTHSYDMVRGMVGRGWGYGIQCAIPRMSFSYDGMRLVPVPILGDAASIKVVGLDLRRAVQRRAIDAFIDCSRRFFSEAWLDIIEPG